MTVFVALLRAVNLGGASTIRMDELRAWCKAADLEKVRTYIASGNLVFESALDEAGVKAAVEAAIHENTGKTVGVLVRTGKEMAAILAANPFDGEPGNKTVAIFLNAPPPKDAVQTTSGAKSEIVKPGKRELYVLYPDGQGRSKLKIPAAKGGTARNMNTVKKLAEMAAG